MTITIQAKATRDAILAIKGSTRRPFLVSRCAVFT